MNKLEIRKEFQELFTDCDIEQDQMLEEDILENGCRDPVLYWSCEGKNIIIDGHRRYNICTKNNIGYETKEMKFKDEEEVIGWIYMNQYQRRNLTDLERSDIRGRDYLRHKNPDGGKQYVVGNSCQPLGDRKVSGQIDHSKEQFEMPGIRDELANKYKVSDRTIRGDAVFSEALQDVEERIGKEAKKNILKGSVVIPKNKIKDALELSDEKLQDVCQGQTTLKDAIREEKKDKAKVKAKEVAKEVKGKKLYSLIHSDLKDVTLSKKADVIITDPPYAKEFICEFHKLGQFAKDNLKDDGILLVLTGQSYLPDYLSILSQYLTYHWTIAYLTSLQSHQIFPKKIFTNWKPLLLFTNGEYKNDWQVDVYNKSTYTERDEHKWQQSEKGFDIIVEKFSEPGNLICDPFCGSGTTGASAIKQNRMFVGIDIEIESIETAELRLGAIQND